MAFVVKDRVKQSTTTTGTGSIVLNGTVSGFQTFTNALSDGDTTYYAIFEVSTNEWEVGVGTWTESTTTLARTTVLASSNSNSAIDLSAQAEVFITQPAGKAAFFDPSGDLTLVQDPTSNLQAATKQYVDTIAAAGLHYHDPVRVEQEGNLSATYSNGTAGVGATLTNNSTQAALTIDGVALSLNDRVLIYEQTNGYENGVYTVTNVGSASTNWVLTRATDADSYGPSDPDSLGQGDAFFVLEGTEGAGELYVMNTEGTITFGTTNITFTQVAATAVYSAGTGLTLTGTEFAADGANITNVDAVTLDGIDSSQFLRSDTVDTKTAGNLNFSDNVKAQFGDSSDLQIYHDGTHSVIEDTGTGDLRVRAQNFYVQNVAGTQSNIYSIDGGQAGLSYAGAVKLATESGGVNITGTLTSDGLTVNGTNDVALITTNQSNYVEGLTLRNTANWGYGSSISFESITSSGGSNAEVGRITSTWNTTGRHGLDFYTLNNNTLLRHMKLDGYGDFSLYEDTGTTAKFFWDASTMALGIGTGTPVNPLTIQQTSVHWPYIALTNTSGTTKSQFGYQVNDDLLDIAANSGGIKFRTNNTETMRLTSAGVLLIGKTSDVYSTEGTAIRGTTVGSKVTITRDGNNVLAMNRLSSDGDIVNIARDGTLMGSITTEGSGTGLIFKARATNGYIGFHANNQTDGIFFDDVTTKRLAPYSTRDNEFDLGDSDRRWKDLYLSGQANVPKIDMYQQTNAHVFSVASYQNVYGPPSGGWNSGTIAHTFNSHNGTAIAQFGIGGSSVNLTSRFFGDVSITGANAPETHAYLNIGSAGSGETRAIDIDGSWSTNESKSISFTYGSDSTNMVGQWNVQYNGPESRMRWGKLYHGADSSTYTMELVSTSTTTADLTVSGSISATTKSFVIDHPTKEGMKLRHGSLEGPEDGVYVRGRLTGETVIELPDYWTGLVHEDSITVQLTAMGGKADLWVESIADNKVTVGCDTEVDCFYFVQATRKDVDAWDVEYEA